MATGKMAQVQAQMAGCERELAKLARAGQTDTPYAEHLTRRLDTLARIAGDVARSQDRRAGQLRKHVILAGIGLAIVAALSACGTATPRAHAGRVDPVAPMCRIETVGWISADGHMLIGGQEECGMAAFSAAAYVPAVACATGDAVRLYYVVPCTAAHTYVAMVDGSDQ